MKNKNWITIGTLLGSALSSPLVWADEPSQTQSETSVINSIEVTANRNLQSIETISKPVSIVDEETIDTRQSTNLTTLMNELPGVSMSPDGMQSGQVVIRGFSTQSFRAPLFVNGDRFRGRNTLEYMLIDPKQVERIEVIRGPASSLYGTDSFGGMINVITKKAEGDVNAPFKFTNSYLDLGYQSVNNSFSERLQIAGAGDGFDVLLGISGRNSEDYASPEGTVPNSDFNSQSFDARIGYTIKPGHRVEMIAKSAEVNRGRAGGQFAAPGAGNEPGELQRQMRENPMEEQYLSLGYEGSFKEAGIETLEASLYRRELNTHITVVPNLNNPDTYVDSYVNGPIVLGGRLVGTVPWKSANVTSTYGMDWFDERRDSTEQSVKGGAKTKTAPETYQQNIGVFMLHEWDTTDKLALSGSLRYDYVKTGLDTDFITDPTTQALFAGAGDTENTHTTWGLGAIYSLTDNWDLIGNINTSFRAPSTAEISAVGTGVYADFRVPNPDIKPETGITYETGARYYSKDFNANFIVFTSDYRDLIDRNVAVIYDGNPATQIQNIGEASISGIEFDFTWKPSNNLTAKANINWIEGRDTANNKPLAQIMPLNGFASLRYESQSSNELYVEGTTEWAMDNDVIDSSQERERSGYMVYNLYAGMNPGVLFGKNLKDTELRFGIENLFDTSYVMPTVPESISYAQSKTNPLVQPGRNFKVGLTVGF